MSGEPVEHTHRLHTHTVGAQIPLLAPPPPLLCMAWHSISTLLYAWTVGVAAAVYTPRAHTRTHAHAHTFTYRTPPFVTYHYPSSPFTHAVTTHVTAEHHTAHAFTFPATHVCSRRTLPAILPCHVRCCTHTPHARATHRTHHFTHAHLPRLYGWTFTTLRGPHTTVCARTFCAPHLACYHLFWMGCAAHMDSAPAILITLPLPDTLPTLLPACGFIHHLPYHGFLAAPCLPHLQVG